jgi:hypothetical protein
MNRGLRRNHTSDPFTDELTIPNGVDKKSMLLLLKLNKQGLSMLEYLIRHGYQFEDKFLITVTDYLDKMGLRSKKSFYLGIDELVKWDVIAKSNELNFFYINPKYFPND